MPANVCSASKAAHAEARALHGDSPGVSCKGVHLRGAAWLKSAYRLTHSEVTLAGGGTQQSYQLQVHSEKNFIFGSVRARQQRSASSYNTVYLGHPPFHLCMHTVLCLFTQLIALLLVLFSSKPRMRDLTTSQRFTCAVRATS